MSAGTQWKFASTFASTHALFIGAVLVSLAGASATVAAKDEKVQAPATAIESCVTRDRLVFGKGDLRAILDEPDLRSVSDAIAELYPVVARDGLAPARLMLWQKRNGELLYVALVQNPANQSESCFTASFAASRFEMTSGLRQKYFYGNVSRY